MANLADPNFDPIKELEDYEEWLKDYHVHLYCLYKADAQLMSMKTSMTSEGPPAERCVMTTTCEWVGTYDTPHDHRLTSEHDLIKLWYGEIDE